MFTEMKALICLLSELLWCVLGVKGGGGMITLQACGERLL